MKKNGIGKADRENPRLIATGGPHTGAEFPITSFPCSIGRGHENHICLADDAYVSKNHCLIEFEDGRCWIRDLGSSNGTMINGVRIETPVSIEPRKSTIYIGGTHLLLLAGEKIRQEELSTLAMDNLMTTGSIIASTTSAFLHQREVEETLFVVDICNSTVFANRHGESMLLKIVHALAMIINQYVERDEALFLKCTGDGFFASFSNTGKALEAACILLSRMDRLVSGRMGLKNPGFRIALHRGPVSVDRQGDRLGIACHLVFRLEGAKPDSLVHEPATPCQLPEVNRILLTDEALASLEGSLSDCFACVGDFLFKGFDHPFRVNLLRMEPDRFLKRLGL